MATARDLHLYGGADLIRAIRRPPEDIARSANGSTTPDHPGAFGAHVELLREPEVALERSFEKRPPEQGAPLRGVESGERSGQRLQVQRVLGRLLMRRMCTGAHE